MHHFRASDGAELAFDERGEGRPALVFVHGWQGDHTVWHDVIAELGPQAHAVAVDLRGSGGSRTAVGPYRLEQFAADLRALIDELEAGPVVLIGHSMGATVALRFALDAPQATRGLVLIAPVPASGGGYSAKGEAYLRSTAGDPVAARNWLTRTFAGAPDEPALRRLCDAAAKTERGSALESFESWAHANFADETRKIQAPVLVIAPEHDAPEASDRKVAALLPDARRVVLADCAHYAIVEKPHEIAIAIRDFVRGLGQRATTP
jgi:pimeloyl-ACP methyl ester carboxylesterase